MEKEKSIDKMSDEEVAKLCEDYYNEYKQSQATDKSSTGGTNTINDKVEIKSSNIGTFLAGENMATDKRDDIVSRHKKKCFRAGADLVFFEFNGKYIKLYFSIRKLKPLPKRVKNYGCRKNI